MARRNPSDPDGEYGPDEEHERARPEPTLPDPRRKDPRYDGDKMGGAFATVVFIAGAAIILAIVFRICMWIMGVDL
jgi:hypothetical protein